ncbi:hypothetical protein F442_13577 [Phytophthora nicotianae P10297]|uniref:Uncharacterized protein n=1 Tax=Phytophthora nicotianae P10297 TaxID=1317064 RepID=W2YY74_PHYNI|nr:hypothetical protein F442_13577 [Phytophthora nicotianae P10297]
MFIITTPELSKAGQEAHPYGDVDKGVQQVDYGSSSHGIAEFETDNTQINSSGELQNRVENLMYATGSVVMRQLLML